MNSDELKRLADSLERNAVALADNIVGVVQANQEIYMCDYGFLLSDETRQALRRELPKLFLGSGMTSSAWALPGSGGRLVLRVQHATCSRRTRNFFTAMVGKQIPHLPEVFAHFEVRGHACFIVKRYEALPDEFASTVADELKRELRKRKYGSSTVPGKMVRAYRRALELSGAIQGRFSLHKVRWYCGDDAHAGNLMRDSMSGRVVIIDPVY